MERLELSIPKAADFKSAVYTIPPHSHYWCPRRDSNSHAEATASKTVVSTSSTTRAINTFMNYDYFERKIDSHAVCTSKTKGKEFIPLYEYNPDKLYVQEKHEDPGHTFVPMRWPHYYELFGASSRNRT